MQQALSGDTLTAFDHIGIRVSDKAKAVRFYERLGFRETGYFPKHEANEMTNELGLRVNLIFNASARTKNSNVLLDEAIKWPGVTHPAFVVNDLYLLREWLVKEGISITEDIHPLGPRRITLFIRDPDGNVLEFNQLTQTDANK
jgi:lactoylglutathione lyase